MKYQSVFDIIGPVMVGPSSSHTAGAARIGLFAHRLIGAAPQRADVLFYGSFAETYKGHGTDRAIVGGLLGFTTEDERIATSLETAAARGIAVYFHLSKDEPPHPNTVAITVKKGERMHQVMGLSIGGGKAEIVDIDGYSVRISGDNPTTVLWHKDEPGVIVSIAKHFYEQSINIATMEVSRRDGSALTAIETDSPVSDALLHLLLKERHIKHAVTFGPLE